MDGRRETVAACDRRPHAVLCRPPGHGGLPGSHGRRSDLLPSHLPIVEPLEEYGWSRVLDTGKSVVLARAGGPIAHRPVPANAGDGFPWP